MCGTCGCSDGSGVTIETGDGEHSHVLPDGRVITHRHAHSHDHSREHDHAHAPSHSHAHDERAHHDSHSYADGHSHSHVDTHGDGHTHSGVHTQEATHSLPVCTANSSSAPRGLESLEIEIMEKNDRLAERNRGYFAGRELTAVNLMSSPGAGKTTLLERTLRELDMPAAVLEGDQETSNDAERIRATGVSAVQINTGQGCHLEADMVWRGLQSLRVTPGSMVFIENVGNLVCPAMFDLGEHRRVVLFSVTEGEDKPLKYPHMFRVADLVLLTKIDLLPHLDFDLEAAMKSVQAICPRAQLMQVSARSGEGMETWREWLRAASSFYKAQDEVDHVNG